MTATDVEESIRAKYEKLAASAEIELLMAGGLGRNAFLLRISSNEKVPPGSDLIVACRRDRTIYIRPAVTILEVVVAPHSLS